MHINCSLPFQGYRNEGQNLGFKSGVLRPFKFLTRQDQHPAGEKQYVAFFQAVWIGGEYCLGSSSGTGMKDRACPHLPNCLQVGTGPVVCCRGQCRLSCLFLRQATKPTRPNTTSSRILSTESGQPPVSGKAELEGRNSNACDTGAD